MFLKKILILSLVSSTLWGLDIVVPKVKSNVVPIIEAIKAKKYKSFKKLFNKSELNKRYSQNQTLLHYASLYDNRRIAELLVQKGALLNAVGGVYNETPLHTAIRYGHLVLAVYLIKNNTPLNVKDKYGETPLDIAKRLNYTNIIQLLEEHGVKGKNNNKKDKMDINKYRHNDAINIYHHSVKGKNIILRHNKFESENKDKNNKDIGEKNLQINIGN